MSINVEANLKIPSLTIKTADLADHRIVNKNVRFIKAIAVDTLPRPGDTVRLFVRLGEPFDATVTRVEWDEGKNLFVVACTYARRSITADEHTKLLADPDWRMNHLP